MISLQHPYSSYDQLGVPLELSPRTRSIIHHRLFLDMEPEGDDPITYLEESEVSTPDTVEEEDFHFRPEVFPYSGGIVASLPPNYVTLAQLVLGTPSAPPLYHNPGWASSAMPTSGLFILNTTSQGVFTLVLVRPTILITIVSSIPITHQAQRKFLKNVSVSSSIPLVSGQVVLLWEILVFL